MAFYQLYREQQIPATKDEVWDFVSSPANLKKITPGHMGFEITSGMPVGKMYEGMIISYKVSPFAGIKMTWVTEITHIKEKSYFVDEQRIGPYRMWHHEHILEEIEQGVLMKDIISYVFPMGFLGRMANGIIIKKQLNAIFLHRFQAVERIFEQYKSKRL